VAEQPPWHAPGLVVEGGVQVPRLGRYRKEHHTSPARLVLHKSSPYTQAEIDGFRAAADSEHLHSLELLWIPSGEAIRLFRRGQHPPLRGTMLIAPYGGLASQPLLLLMLSMHLTAESAPAEVSVPRTSAQLYEGLFKGFLFREIRRRAPGLNDTAVGAMVERETSG
jgi:hypothetical protein